MHPKILALFLACAAAFAQQTDENPPKQQRLALFIEDLGQSDGLDWFEIG